MGPITYLTLTSDCGYLLMFLAGCGSSEVREARSESLEKPEGIPTIVSETIQISLYNPSKTSYKTSDYAETGA